MAGPFVESGVRPSYPVLILFLKNAQSPAWSLMFPSHRTDLVPATGRRRGRGCEPGKLIGDNPANLVGAGQPAPAPTYTAIVDWLKKAHLQGFECQYGKADLFGRGGAGAVVQEEGAGVREGAAGAVGGGRLTGAG